MLEQLELPDLLTTRHSASRLRRLWVRLGSLCFLRDDIIVTKQDANEFLLPETDSQPISLCAKVDLTVVICYHGLCCILNTLPCIWSGLVPLVAIFGTL